MTAVKKTFGPKDGGSYVARAKARWNSSPPDWVMKLAEATDAEVAMGGSQATLGKRIAMEGSLISGIIGNRYPGKLDRHEATVRGALMSATVQCPALSIAMGRDECAGHQQKKPFSASSPQAVKLRRACPTCPNNLGAKS